MQKPITYPRAIYYTFTVLTVLAIPIIGAVMLAGLIWWDYYKK